MCKINLRVSCSILRSPQIIKALSTNLFVLITCVTFAQQQPAIFKSFRNNKGIFIIDNLILSSDGLFFSFASCECGKEYYGKGKWQIKGNKLYLKGFDSTMAFPNSKINFITGQPTDSVTIRAYDYFGKPITNLLLGLVYQNSTKEQFHFEFVNQEGKLIVSKKDYSGFFLIYETKGTPSLSGKENPYYFLDKHTKEVVINIDFAAAGFDRTPIPFNYGKQVFTIRHGNLYRKGRTPAFVKTSNKN